MRVLEIDYKRNLLKSIKKKKKKNINFDYKNPSGSSSSFLGPRDLFSYPSMRPFNCTRSKFI